MAVRLLSFLGIGPLTPSLLFFLPLFLFLLDLSIYLIIILFLSFISVASLYRLFP